MPIIPCMHFSVTVNLRSRFLAVMELTLDRYCEAGHVFVSFLGRSHGQADKVLLSMGRGHNVVLTVNLY
jgi:hypothetical protein